MGEATRRDDKLNVFISYSRDDLAFTDQLDATLRLAGFATMLDRVGIRGGEAWEPRLGQMIRDADTVVFVLSPASVASKTCAWELAEAKRLGKRIIPVACRPLGSNDAPPPGLAALNYIFFYPEPRKSGTGFAPGLFDLAAALNTDLDWLREHTRYLQRATEWNDGGRPANRLLSGPDIAQARAWAARRPRDAPEPTALHLDFIHASEQEQASRANAERQRLEEMAAAQAERATALQAAETALKDKQLAQQREAEASRRVVRRTLAGLAAALVLAVVAGAAWRIAVSQKQLAEAANLQLQHEYLAMLAEVSIDETLEGSAVPGEIAVADPAPWIPLMSRGQQTFATARLYRDGRVLAVAHDGVLNALENKRSRGFLKRSLQWLKAPNRSLVVLFSQGHCEWIKGADKPALLSLLDELQYRVGYVPGAIDEAQLAGASVLVIGNAWGDLAAPEIQAVERFVAGGGGLLLAGLGWSWQAYGAQPGYACVGNNQGQQVTDLATYPMNRLGLPYGLQWTDQVIPK